MNVCIDINEIASTNRFRNLFSSAKCNKFVISEMDSSGDFSTKLLRSSFSQAENSAFVKYFSIIMLTTLFYAAFIQVEVDNP